MDNITAMIVNYKEMAIVGVVGFVILFAMKKIPNQKIYDAAEKALFGLGRVVTLGLAKWKWTKDIWNKVVEEWFIDLLDNVVVAGIRGFIRGLRSDNGLKKAAKSKMEKESV